MKSKCVLPALLVLWSTILYGQLHLEWAFSTGSLASDLTGSMKSDHEDNLYVLSYYRDTLDLDPGPGTDIAYPTTSHVITLSKFNAAGEYQWSGRFWDMDEVSGALFEIKNNKMRLVLTFTDSLIYQLHGQNLIEESMPGRHSCFLDLGLDGQVLNIHYFETPHVFYLTHLTSLPNGNTIVSGSFRDNVSFSDASHQLISAGEYDGFIVMLDEDLHPVWSQHFASVMDDYLADLYYHPSGRIYFALVHEDEVSVETTQGLMTFPKRGRYNSVYGYIDMTGGIQTAYGFGGDMGDEITAMAVDNDFNVYICGYFEDMLNFAHPSQNPVVHFTKDDSDGFVAKYDQNGLLIWERIYTTSYYGGVYTLTLKRGTELYLSGILTLKSDLDPGPDSLIVDGGMQSDIFVSKLTTDGDLKYSYHFAGNSFEGVRNVIVSTGSSRVFVHGYFYDQLDCDHTDGEQLLVAPGGADVFVLGFSEDNVISAVLNVKGSYVNVYPNPTSGAVSVTSGEPIRGCTLMTIDGRVVHREDNDEHAMSLDLAQFPPGLYLLNIHTATESQVKRILRQ